MTPSSLGMRSAALTTSWCPSTLLRRTGRLLCGREWISAAMLPRDRLGARQLTARGKPGGRRNAACSGAARRAEVPCVAAHSQPHADVISDVCGPAPGVFSRIEEPIGRISWKSGKSNFFPGLLVGSLEASPVWGSVISRRDVASQGRQGGLGSKHVFLWLGLWGWLCCPVHTAQSSAQEKCCCKIQLLPSPYSPEEPTVHCRCSAGLGPR